ncbi:MAG: ATP-dependent dethiobiotin synthetase BioD [Actinomycetota bacterium]
MGAFVTVVSGTGTGVGKTWVTVRLLEILQGRGVGAAVRKPVQSFDPTAGPPDAAILAAAAGVAEDEVCPLHRSYPLAMAPPIAARELGREPLTLSDLLAEMRLPERGLVFIEGVGGPRSPLAEDADTCRLAEGAGAGMVVVVCPAGLGAINAAVLSTAAFGKTPAVVFLNRYDAADAVHRTNLRWLTEKENLEVEVEIAALARRFAAASNLLPEAFV